jgi:hypothetical protein
MIIKKKKPPLKPILLKDAIILIAQMGGYLTRKSDSLPGPKALWQGLTQLYHVLYAQEMLIKLKSYG